MAKIKDGDANADEGTCDGGEILTGAVGVDSVVRRQRMC
jgi:hypothetical protein